MLASLELGISLTQPINVAPEIMCLIFLALRRYFKVQSHIKSGVRMNECVYILRKPDLPLAKTDLYKTFNYSMLSAKSHRQHM